jgi:hypothetical protein
MRASRALCGLALIAGLADHETACLVTDKFQCSGDDTTCQYAATAEDCSVRKGCTFGPWCVAGCSKYQTQTECTSFVCSWDAGAQICTGRPNVCYGNTKDQCDQDPNCVWGEGCFGVDCHTLQSQAECSQYSYCFWAKPGLND